MTETLRSIRSRVHAEFDPIWKRGYVCRADAYYALAREMGIRFDECHVAMFDYDQCVRAIAACQVIGPRLRSRRLRA